LILNVAQLKGRNMAKAIIAISRVKIPSRGHFVNAKDVHAVGMRVDNVPHVDLVIQRDGGPYIVLRLDIEAAEMIRDHLTQKINYFTGEQSQGGLL
jgi:hypothetical protein